MWGGVFVGVCVCVRVICFGTSTATTLIELSYLSDGNATQSRKNTARQNRDKRQGHRRGRLEIERSVETVCGVGGDI